MATTINLNYKARKWQAICHADKARFRVIVLHRRGGKSTFATMELIDAALQFKQELGLFAFISPFLSQSKAIAWGMIKFRLKEMIQHDMVHVNEAELTITFQHNGAKLKLYGGDNYDSLRGVRLDGVVIDEVANIRPELWESVVQPALSDRNGWAIFIGTPGGIDLFSEKYHKAKTLPNWSAHLFTVYDTDAIDPEEVARLKRDMSDSAFDREFMCNFDAAGEDQLLSMAEVEVAANREYKMGEFSYSAKIIGVDPARMGADSSVIMKRQGFMVYDPISFHGIDNMALADQVAYHINDWKPDAVFIDVGNGGGVIDRLRQLGHSVIEVPFGGKAANPKFVNKRTEMYDAMRSWIREGGKIPNHIRLKQDLATPTYWFNGDKMILESKDDIKKRGLPSSDYSDALACTFASPVVRKPQEVQSPHDTGYKAGYDPFDRGRLMKDVGIKDPRR
ncbi:MAG: terminase family protein [Alphaproteobacteria bacterium]